jgi:hypothetical protein
MTRGTPKEANERREAERQQHIKSLLEGELRGKIKPASELRFNARNAREADRIARGCQRREVQGGGVNQRPPART